MAREPEELKAAVDSMFRIRAVESPPDANGTRTIWHRGTRGAELVTQVDAAGRVARQDFTLFDELLQWERETGFRSAAVEVGGTDGAPVTERLARAATALAGYSGHDRFLLHLRDRLSGGGGVEAPALDDDRPITRSAPVVLAELGAKKPPVATMSRLAIAVAVLAGVLFVAAVVMFFVSQ
jgi:hypothetical protein